MSVKWEIYVVEEIPSSYCELDLKLHLYTHQFEMPRMSVGLRSRFLAGKRLSSRKRSSLKLLFITQFLLLIISTSI